MRLTALFWWIDRWRKSSAYMDMTLEQQGAYRNLLDEAHLRGGPLPNDERILAKACGDMAAWPTVRTVVMARFELRPDGWHNATLDNILRESVRRAENQANYRARKNNGSDNGSDNGAGQRHDNKPASPSPSPSPSLISGTVSVSGKNKKEDIAPTALLSADGDFELFRQAYPASRRVGGKTALKAWKSATAGRNGTHLEAMARALEQHKRSEQWQTPKLIPLMTTWLNQERWNQTLPEPKGYGATAKTAGNAAALQRFVDKGR